MNKISEWLNKVAADIIEDNDRFPASAREALAEVVAEHVNRYKNAAAAVERLVEAAEKYWSRTWVDHTLECSTWNGWDYKCDCGANDIEAELTEALKPFGSEAEENA